MSRAVCTTSAKPPRLERAADRRREQHRHALGLPLVPRRDQPAGVFQHLRLGGTLGSSLLLGGSGAPRFHLPLVEAHVWISPQRAGASQAGGVYSRSNRDTVSERGRCDPDAGGALISQKTRPYAYKTRIGGVPIAYVSTSFAERQNLTLRIGKWPVRLWGMVMKEVGVGILVALAFAPMIARVLFPPLLVSPIFRLSTGALQIAIGLGVYIGLRAFENTDWPWAFGLALLGFYNLWLGWNLRKHSN